MMGTTAPRKAVSGKMVLLGLLLGVIVLAIALYVVLIPMHFGGKERIQEEHRQQQIEQETND